jgi:hypothetical protein
MRVVARRFEVSLATVQLWVGRAGATRLDRVDWSDRPTGPKTPPNRTAADVEDLLVATRRRLKDDSPLGEYGAAAVHADLLAAGTPKLPSVRTIARVFERRGLVDAHRRVRRAPPPKGWYLADVAARRAEIDSFDVVQGLKIKGGPLVEVFNGVSVHGGLVASWPVVASVTAAVVVSALVEHWREHGLPDYAQFDNDTLFQGPHQHRDVIGRVIRLCLSLGVVPVFAPVSEHVGDVASPFQAAIESYNGLWQTKVWSRVRHASLESLVERSRVYVAAHRCRTAVRQAVAPARRPFPATWSLDFQHHPADYPEARIVFVRRTDAAGRVRLLGHTFDVDAQWVHRLARCEVRLAEGRLQIYRLRRSAPESQPLLCEHVYVLPRRSFSE